MKRVIAAVLMAGLAWAQPGQKVAMVLKVEGKVLNQQGAVVTGQLWAPGDKIQLTQGSRVTVLMLNKGQRQEIGGLGSVEVAAGGLKLQGRCTARDLASTQLRLALTGDNHRQIGGMVLRGASKKLANSVFDQIEVDAHGLKISRPAQEGAPPKLQFCFLDQYYIPALNKDLKSMEMPPMENLPQPAFAPQISGKAEGQRWTWEVPWPLEDPSRSYGLKVIPVENPTPKDPLLYTRVYHSSDQEQKDLAAAREQVKVWKKKEPGSQGPSVYLANLLDEKGQLQAALEALKPALSQNPHDSGLLQMRARLLMDLGRYAQAAQALKAVKN
ncbi:MAG: tetratricopeptide repeat protein [Vulcanimicrobiota bacterium]